MHQGLMEMIGGTGMIVGFDDAKVQETISNGSFFKKLLQWHECGYLLGAGSPSGKDTDTSREGIVQGHAYSLLRVCEERDAKGTHQLVQLRNPWGNTGKCTHSQ